MNFNFQTPIPPNQVFSSPASGVGRMTVRSLGMADMQPMRNFVIGNYLAIANNLSEVDDIIARANIGLGSAATLNADNTANNIPILDSGGKLSAALLPAIAVNNTYPVPSQAAMLALAANVGDVAVRSDTSETYILRAAPASMLANWTELLNPAFALTSAVAGVADTQTLTNKILSGSANTFSNIPESAVTNLTSDLADKASTDQAIYYAIALG